MNWLVVALSAYLLLAIVNLVDKFLVESVLKNARAYAFAACFMGLAVLASVPWYLNWPGTALAVWNLINGAVFAIALWFLYEALYRGEASRVLVLVGGLTPIFSLFFSQILFKEHYSSGQWSGIVFLLVGIFIIALLPKSRSFLSRVFSKLRLVQEDKVDGLMFAFASALAYSLYFISTKSAYAGQSFISAFIWNRLGAAAFVLIFLFNRSDRKAVKAIFKSSEQNNKGWLVVINQIFGSLGFVLQNYAIFLGSVVLVNALQGIQYAFLLILSTILAVSAPRFLKETFSWKILLSKSAAVLAIALGLYFIAF